MRISAWIAVLGMGAWFCVAVPAQEPMDASGQAGSPGCGEAAARFDVKTEKKHPGMQPESGKALVYLIEDDTEWQS